MFISKFDLAQSSMVNSYLLDIYDSKDWQYFE